ncbi:hypothetical protein Tco_0023937 [Tanacetum coccineum]
MSIARLRGSLSTQNPSEPMSVELNMWHQLHRPTALSLPLLGKSLGGHLASVVRLRFTMTGIRVLFRTSKFRILAVNGSVSSHSHGWKRSSSSFDLCFLDFQCPPWSWSFSESYSSLVSVHDMPACAGPACSKSSLISC